MSGLQREVGRSNGGLGSVSVGRHLGVTYIVYATAENVLVLNADCELVQVLRHPNHAKQRGISVRCVDMCSATGRVAAAYGNQVLIFAPSSQVRETRASWEFEYSLEHKSVVGAVSWKNTGDVLLIGGESLTLWQINSGIAGWSKVWSTTCSSPVILARFSPDGRFIATMAANDRLLKVWYKPEAELFANNKAPAVYQFVYLYHPRAILNFSWRKPSLRSMTASGGHRNILLTSSKDNVCRIWSETGVDESVRFFMCAMIDPAHMTVASNSDAKLEGPFGWFDTDELYTALEAAVEPDPAVLAPQTPSNSFSSQSGGGAPKIARQMSSHVPFSMRGGTSFASSSNDSLSQKRYPPGIDYFRRLRSRLPGILSDSPDLLFQVQRDGSLVIWGIQHLSEEPRRIPKVVLVLRTPNALPAFICSSVCPDVCVFAERSVFVPGAYLIPPELSLLLQGPSGRVLTFGINLKDIFSAVRDSGKLSLHADLAGHKSPVQVFGAHPNLPFVVSSSSYPHELVVWRVKYRENFHSRSLVQVNSLATITSVSKEPFAHIVWVPQLEEDVSAKPKGTLFLYRFKRRPQPDITLLSQFSFPHSVCTTPISAGGSFVSLHIHLERSSVTVNESVETTTASLSASFVPSSSFDIISTSLSGQPASIISQPKIFLMGLTASSDLIMWQLRTDDNDTDPQMAMTQCWADNIFRNTEEGHGDDHGDLVFADQLDSVTVSMTHGTLSPAFMFCTVHKNDRVLRLWRCVYSSIDESVREATACGNNICRIAISTELPRVPSTVSAAAYGFIAVAYADPTVHDDRDATKATVDIYDYLRDCSKLVRVHQWQQHEPMDSDEVRKGLSLLGISKTPVLPVSLSWTCLPDGSLALAVGLGFHVYVLGQFRSRQEKTSRPVWECLASVLYSENTPLLQVAFTGPEGHVLAVSLTEPILSLVSPWAWNWSDILTTNQSGHVDDTPPSLAMMLAAARPSLPDYHPDVLIQYALSGDFELVRSILRHLRDSLVLLASIPENKPKTQIPPMPLGKLVTSVVPASVPQTSATLTFAEADESAKGLFAPAASNANKYDDLFAQPMEFKFDDEHEAIKLDSHEKTEDREWKHNDEDMFAYLSETLMSLALPGISQNEQVSLLAVIDTLVQLEKQKRALDDNGGRFTLSLRLFTFLRRTLPPQARPIALSQRDTAWAMHSQSEDILLELCSSMIGAQNQITWKTVKPFGLGWWPQSTESLRRYVEIMAKNQFNNADPKDPIACSLFYLALQKRKVLGGLWKMATNHPDQQKMSQFYSNDFDQPRWQQAALKNAYVLLGRQKFEYAAAFFLLGGKLKDAVHILYKNLGDMQLAVIVARLANDNNATLKALLLKDILPQAVLNGDRWLASNVLWLSGDRERAAAIIVGEMTLYLEPDELEEYNILVKMKADEIARNNRAEPAAAVVKQTASATDSCLLTHYSYLRSLPSTVKATQGSKWPAVTLEQVAAFATNVAASYEDLGAAVLALEAVRVGSFLCVDIAKEQAKEIAKKQKAALKEQKQAAAAATSANQDKAENLFGPSSGSQDKAEFLFGGPADTASSASSLFALDAPVSFSFDSGTMDFGAWGPSTTTTTFSFDEKPTLPPSLAALAEPPSPTESEDDQDDADAATKILLDHYLRILAVQRCSVSLRLCLSVAIGLDMGNRIWFIDRQQQSQRLLTYGQESYDGLYVLSSLAGDPSVHPSLVQRWLKRVCHMTERPLAHCALIIESSFEHEQADMTVHISAPMRVPKPAALAGVTDLLYRKCTLVASLAFSLARDWDEILERHQMSSSSGSTTLPEKPRQMVLKLEFVQNMSIALLEALYIERHTVFQRLLASGDREGPGKLLEILWCIIMASISSALMQGQYVGVAYWLRGIRGVFLNQPLNGQYEPFRTLLTIATTAQEEANSEIEAAKDLRHQRHRSQGHESDNGGCDEEDDDDGGIEIKTRKQAKPGSVPSHAAMAYLMDLATFRYLFCRLEATLEDLESQLDVSSAAISDGLITSMALLIGVKERHVADSLGVFGRSDLAQFCSTTPQQRLWSTLQELYSNANITDRYVNLATPVLNSRSSSSSDTPILNDPLRFSYDNAATISASGGSHSASPSVERLSSPVTSPPVGANPPQAGGGGLSNMSGAAVVANKQLSVSTAIPRVISAPQLAGIDGTTTLYTPNSLPSEFDASETMIRAADIIESFCINQAEVDSIALVEGKRVHELKTTNLPINLGHPQQKSHLNRSDGEIFDESFGISGGAGFGNSGASLLSVPERPSSQPRGGGGGGSGGGLSAAAAAAAAAAGSSDDQLFVPVPQHAASPRMRRIMSATAADKVAQNLTFNDDVLLRSNFDQMRSSGHRRYASYGGREAASVTMSGSNNPGIATPDASGLVRNVAVATMASHPSLPFYLTGTHDGLVTLWQYHQPPPPLLQYRLPESPRVTSLRFSLFGVKFGCTDTRGFLNLWNFDARADVGQQAYQTVQVHSKAAYDFTFLSSATFIATGGLSETQKNVALWDTLLPPGKARVRGFIVHENGCHSVAHSPQNNLLISGGKKGDLNIFDLRMMQPLRSRIAAHTHNVKAIVVDDANGYFYTGSTDGDIKAWSMQTFECEYVFHNAHQKNTFLRPSFDRNPVSTYGVMDLVVDGQYLYSCGADGTLKRQQLLSSANR